MSFAEFLYTRILRPRPLRRLTNAALLRMIPRTTRVGPATIHLDQEDPVVSGALALRVYERSEIEFFLKHCRGNVTFVDVGANVGLYTALAMHTLSEHGRVVAIEPRPKTFPLLERNIAANRRAAGPRVDAFCLAAAAEAGRRTLFQNPDNKADNRVYESHDFAWEVTEVPARPLDDLLTDEGIQAIHVLKMDVQGFEQMVVRGMQRTLRRSSRIVLLSEFWPKGLREAGGDAHAYLKELTDLGFQLHELGRGGTIQPVAHWDALIRGLPGRKYTNLVGMKGSPGLA